MDSNRHPKANEIENKTLASIVLQEGDVLIARDDDEQIQSLQKFIRDRS